MTDEPYAARVSQGVKVFGSAIVRVAPDTASIATAVSRREANADAAFEHARTDAQRVIAFLHDAGVTDFRSSQITLSRVTRYRDREQVFVGFKAEIGFQVTLWELDTIEPILSGLVAAGADALKSVAFETTRLKEVRLKLAGGRSQPPVRKPNSIARRPGWRSDRYS